MVHFTNKEIAHLKSVKPDFTVSRELVETELKQLEHSITYLRNDDKFLKDLFAMPCIFQFYQYDTYTGDLLSGDFLSNMYSTQSYSHVMLSNLFRLNDMVESEIERRTNKYTQLTKHIEEQNIIFAHTPSIWPSTERTTSKFGFRRSPFTGVPSFHEGADLTARTGTPIKAAANGVVVFAGWRTGYGNLVTIDHGFGYMTRYAHNSKLLVKVDDNVVKGDIISLSGSTGRTAGPHLHYEVLYNGIPVNANKFLPPVNK